jgi:hypothetical protein
MPISSHFCRASGRAPLPLHDLPVWSNFTISAETPISGRTSGSD